MLGDVFNSMAGPIDRLRYPAYPQGQFNCQHSGIGINSGITHFFLEPKSESESRKKNPPPYSIFLGQPLTEDIKQSTNKCIKSKEISSVIQTRDFSNQVR